jgi:endonuclease/exonuclease/phosphatase family metal-dependent hydrolase
MSSSVTSKLHDLKIVSLNLLAGVWVDIYPPTLIDKDSELLKSEVRAKAQAAQIRKLDGDITLVQELQESHIALLQEELGDEYVKIEPAWNSKTSASEKNGVGCIIKKSFSDSLAIANAILDKEEGDAIQFISLLDGTNRVIANVHLDWAKRTEQAKNIQLVFKEYSLSNEFLWCIMGDFNGDWSEFMKCFSLFNLVPVTRLLNTWFSGTDADKKTSIDHVFLYQSPAAQTLYATFTGYAFSFEECIRLNGSDHNPICISTHYAESDLVTRPAVAVSAASAPVAASAPTRKHKLENDSKNDALFDKRVRLTRAKEQMPADVLNDMHIIRLHIAACQANIIEMVRDGGDYDVGTLINFCARMNEAKDLACKSMILAQL